MNQREREKEGVLLLLLLLLQWPAVHFSFTPARPGPARSLVPGCLSVWLSGWLADWLNG